MLSRFGIVIFFIFVYNIYCLPFVAENGLQVGGLGPNDSWLFTLKTSKNPTPGVNITSETHTISMKNVNITYVVGAEYGHYPDATIELLEGGPGYDYVKVIIEPGPSQGWNYSISIFGHRLSKNVEITTMKLEKYSSS